MRNFAHRLKHYSKEDLEGKELYKVETYLSWHKDTIEVHKLDIERVTDKTVLLVGGGRIPISEVGLNKEHGRLVCPKEDIQEIVDKYRVAMTEMYEKEIARLNEEIHDITTARIKLIPSRMEQQALLNKKLEESQ